MDRVTVCGTVDAGSIPTGCTQGEVAELVYGAVLEKLYWGNPVVGSNPTLSAYVR
jgi:hypothetical protein